MLQAIVTKYLPATNTRGSRIKATCAGGSTTRAYDYALDLDAQHHAAAIDLCNKLGWTFSRLHSGILPNGDGAHVLEPQMRP